MDKRQITVGVCAGLGLGCIGGTLMNLHFALGVAAISLVVAVVLGRSKPSSMILQEPETVPVIQTVQEEEELLEIGFRMLGSFRYYKTTIKSRAMRQHLTDIIENIEGILIYTKKHPAVALRIKRFFTYYLTETEGMVSTYDQLSHKKEIDKNDYDVLTKIEQTIGVAKVAAANYYEQIKKDNIMDLEVHLEVFEREMQLDGVVQK
jgi:hypothetical protein